MSNIPERLSDFFTDHPKVALAFSGGADSAYLAYAAKTCGADIHAYYMDSQFQPRHQLCDAIELAKSLDVPLTVLKKDVLMDNIICENSAERCYHCKTALFSLLRDVAKADGYSFVIDGTNSSDMMADRPGMRALIELGIRSPLRAAFITKDELRKLSKAAGLITWNKPSNSCLATRIKTGDTITQAELDKVEYSENVMARLGFSDFRVLVRGKAAILRLREDEFSRAFYKIKDIRDLLSPYFTAVYLDLEAR